MSAVDGGPEAGAVQFGVVAMLFKREMGDSFCQHCAAFVKLGGCGCGQIYCLDMQVLGCAA
jgi:hypothetical protein